MEGEMSVRPRVAVLAVGNPHNEQGGAERFYTGLRDALECAGANAEIHWEISDESGFTGIKASYLRFYDCDLTAFDGVISTKVPGYMVRHRNHICYLLHTMRVFYDMFYVEFPEADEALLQQRLLIQELDTAALQSPRTRRIFAIGHEVKNRLSRYNGLDAEVLYPATTMSNFRDGGSHHLLLPGRLHRWKRIDLVIDAMRHVSTEIELIITGTGEDEARLRALAKSDRRIRFVGRVSDAELIDLYADARAILFVPLREDFGLVTLEAFLSGKPVLTCIDSGEPARIVEHGVSGIVSEANPHALAACIERLASDPGIAEALGRGGAASIEHVTWDRVAARLMAALGFPAEGVARSKGAAK
jgi:glycosyltransferase involved in cell wall biosynthesis